MCRPMLWLGLVALLVITKPYGKSFWLTKLWLTKPFRSSSFSFTRLDHPRHISGLCWGHAWTISWPCGRTSWTISMRRRVAVPCCKRKRSCATARIATWKPGRANAPCNWRCFQRALRTCGSFRSDCMRDGQNLSCRQILQLGRCSLWWKVTPGLGEVISTVGCPATCLRMGNQAKKGTAASCAGRPRLWLLSWARGWKHYTTHICSWRLWVA